MSTNWFSEALRAGASGFAFMNDQKPSQAMNTGGFATHGLPTVVEVQCLDQLDLCIFKREVSTPAIRTDGWYSRFLEEIDRLSVGAPHVNEVAKVVYNVYPHVEAFPRLSNGALDVKRRPHVWNNIGQNGGEDWEERVEYVKELAVFRKDLVADTFKHLPKVVVRLANANRTRFEELFSI